MWIFLAQAVAAEVRAGDSAFQMCGNGGINLGQVGEWSHVSCARND